MVHMLWDSQQGCASLPINAQAPGLRAPRKAFEDCIFHMFKNIQNIHLTYTYSDSYPKRTLFGSSKKLLCFSHEKRLFNMTHQHHVLKSLAFSHVLVPY